MKKKDWFLEFHHKKTELLLRGKFSHRQGDVDGKKHWSRKRL